MELYRDGLAADRERLVDRHVCVVDGQRERAAERDAGNVHLHRAAQLPGDPRGGEDERALAVG